VCVVCVCCVCARVHCVMCVCISRRHRSVLHCAPRYAQENEQEVRYQGIALVIRVTISKSVCNNHFFLSTDSYSNVCDTVCKDQFSFAISV